MATVEFWIQIESNPWDVAPRNIDRLTGQTMQQITGQAPVLKTLISPVTGVVQTRTMFRPLSQDALILRRYTPNWAAPDDRKVNPWDLNEPDPTDNGTMGTIPGAVIECNVGDEVIVHFRNQDTRSGKARRPAPTACIRMASSSRRRLTAPSRSRRRTQANQSALRQPNGPPSAYPD